MLMPATDMVTCYNCSFAGRQWIKEPPMLEYILSTNDAPGEAEAAEIRQVVEEGKKDLVDLEGEIARLTGVLQQLKASRNRLVKHISSCKRALAPIRRLPLEILAEIFLYSPGLSKGRNATDDMSKMMKASKPLLNVCSRWRMTAVSLQDLWSFIDIKLGFRDTETRLTNLSSLIDLHLRRSKNAPLYINLTSRNELNVQPLINALVPHSSRWRFARIAVPAASLQQLTQIKGSLDRLRRLDLCVTDSHTPNPEIFQMFEFAPQLSRLRLSTYAGGYQSLPWSQLTRLELSLSLSQCLLILSLAPDITECLLSCEHKAFDNLNTPVSVVLPHLRALHIDGFFGSSITALSYITTPVLESFSLNTLSLQLIDKDTTETTDLVGSLLPFVRGASRTLKHLSLYGSSLETDVFLALLQETPNLRCLYLDDHAGLISSEKVHSQLRYHPNTETCLVPLLETIKVTVVSSRRLGQFDCDVFVDMVESRWKISSVEERVTRLQSVALVDSMNAACVNKEAIKRLEAFQSEGLELSMSCYQERGPK